MIFVRFVLFCVDTVSDFLDKNCHYMAGAISFFTLFAIFPLFVAIVSVLSYVGPVLSDEVNLAMNIADVLPVSSEFVSEEVASVVRSRPITSVASVIGLLWASTAAFGAIRKGVNAAWGVKRTRPYLRERLIDFALVLGAGVVVLAVLLSSPALGVVKEVTEIVAPDSEIFSGNVVKLASLLLLPGLSFLTFLVLYRLLPNTDVRLGDVWLGALLATFAFQGVSLGFVWAVGNFLDYNLLYGSVGAVVALLTWVYLSAIILLFGALVTSRYTEYASSLEAVLGSETQNLKILWTGFSRVRLRVVASPRAG